MSSYPNTYIGEAPISGIALRVQLHLGRPLCWRLHWLQFTHRDAAQTSQSIKSREDRMRYGASMHIFVHCVKNRLYLGCCTLQMSSFFTILPSKMTASLRLAATVDSAGRWWKLTSIIIGMDMATMYLSYGLGSNQNQYECEDEDGRILPPIYFSGLQHLGRPRVGVDSLSG
jgi:hypothetical protein